MKSTGRMVNRLPDFYQAEREDSTINILVDSFAETLSHFEEQINNIMRSRWFEVADIEDLERIGALFGLDRVTGEGAEAYRERLRVTINELLQGAGTVESVRTLVEATILTEPEIIENPKVIAKSEEHILSSDGAWRELNNSIAEDYPTIMIRGLSNVRNPTFTNVSAEEWVRYEGRLRKGAYLIINPDLSAKLAGIDVTDRIKANADHTPRITKQFSDWRYTDMTARFSLTRFDESTFRGSESDAVSVQMTWEEAQPAVFIVRMPLYPKKEETGERVAGYEKHLRDLVWHLVDSVKTAGVLANVNYWDDFSEANTMEEEFKPQVNTINDEEMDANVSCKMDSEWRLRDTVEMKDEFAACGAFGITTFNSDNGFG